MNLLSAKEFMKVGEIQKANKDYKKSWNLYIDLQYDEKKIIYKEILKLYKDLMNSKK